MNWAATRLASGAAGGSSQSRSWWSWWAWASRARPCLTSRMAFPCHRPSLTASPARQECAEKPCMRHESCHACTAGSISSCPAADKGCMRCCLSSPASRDHMVRFCLALFCMRQRCQLVQALCPPHPAAAPLVAQVHGDGRAQHALRLGPAGLLPRVHRLPPVRPVCLDHRLRGRAARPHPGARTPQSRPPRAPLGCALALMTTR